MNNDKNQRGLNSNTTSESHGSKSGQRGTGSSYSRNKGTDSDQGSKSGSQGGSI